MHISKNQIKHINSLSQKKYRQRHESYVIEGYTLLKEALDSNVSFEYLVYTKSALEKPRYKELVDSLYDFTEKMLWASDAEIKKFSNFETSDGILGVTKMPQGQQVQGDTILALDAINDPGNLGTIMRTAEWFGVETIILGEGSVDPFNAKVVRSSMGSLFRINIISANNLVTVLQDLKKKKYRLVATVLDGDKTMQEIDGQKKVIVMGSESHGISDEVRAECDDFIKIKGTGKAESLNVGVAAGIILSQINE